MNDILDFFKKLLDTDDWPPRWHCGKWSDFHGWLYIISDILIWAAYFAIPVIIIRFITYKKHQRFIKLYFLFAAFILACGATHLLDAITFWIPLYRLSALTRAITAVVSWLTVFNLIKLLPYAFSLKPPQLLEAEVEMRRKADEELLLKNQELEESRQTFKNAFDYSAIGIALVSMEGRWLDVNQAVCNMLGYTKEELLERTFQEITHPDDLDQDIDYVNQLLHGRMETYQMEKRYFRKDGQIVWVLLSVSLVKQHNEVAYFVSQIMDITAKKQLITEVEQKNIELEKANKELQNHITRINEFNRIIGHNLRGPASSLINVADFLEENNTEENRNLLLPKVKGTSWLILNTLNDLKDFLEIQLNHEHQYKPTPFKTALQNGTRILEEQVKETGAGIEAVFGVEEVGYPKVYLESLFYNLVSNALKYRSLTRPPVIAIETRATEEHIVLTVKDNGIGIDMKRYGNDVFKYRKIFHKGYESNGVGLFLTRTQLEACGGKIEVESEVGEGTIFSIYFKQL